MHFRQAVDEIRAGGDPLAAQGERLSGKRRKEEDRRNRIAAGQLMKKENVRIEPDGLFFRVHGAVPGTKLFKDFAWRKAGAKYDASTRTWLVSDPHLFYAVAKNVGHYEKVGGGADAVQDWSKQGLHTAWVQHGSKQQPGAKAARRTMAKQAMALHEAMQQTNDPKEKKRLAFRLQRLQRLHSAGGRGASIRRATKAEAGWPAVVKADQAVPLSSARVQVQPPKATRKKYPFQGYIDFQGLQIDVENRAGSTRSGTDADGNEWSVQMHAHYGEIRGTEGTDGDKLDVYVGPLADSSLVVVVHQADPKDGSYDEDKVMLGFATKESALACYNKQYDTPGYYGGCTVLSIGEFWRWVEDRNNRGRKVIAAVDPVAVGARTGLTLKASTVIKAKAANVGEVRRRKDGDYRKFPDGSWRLIRSTAERKEAKQLVDPHRRASSRVVGEGASAVAIPKHAKGGSWGEAAFYLPPEYRGDLDKAKPGKAPKPTVVQYKNKAGETITRYEYPPEWTEKASKYKFARVAHILAQLETISSELKREFTNKGLDAATRANAAALYLTLHQGTRPGGAGETRGEPTYGITNLQRRHVAIHKDGTVELQYRGKSGVSRTVAMKDMQLAETIREFMGGRDQVNSKKPLWPANRQAMAERLKQYNEHFKVKDLRTAVAMRIGTKAVEEVLQQEWDTKTKTKAKRAAKAIVKEIATKVSQQLGNTPSVAQKNYLAPELFETALEMAGIDPKVLQ